VKLRQAPRWILKIVNPATVVFLVRRVLIGAQVFDVQCRVNAGEKPADNRRTIFHQLLDPNAAEGHVVPPIEAMTDEAGILVAAASETVGITVTLAFYRVTYESQSATEAVGRAESCLP
jgi:hypothetical protein